MYLFAFAVARSYPQYSRKTGAADLAAMAARSAAIRARIHPNADAHPQPTNAPPSVRPGNIVASQSSNAFLATQSNAHAGPQSTSAPANTTPSHTLPNVPPAACAAQEPTEPPGVRWTEKEGTIANIVVELIVVKSSRRGTAPCMPLHACPDVGTCMACAESLRGECGDGDPAEGVAGVSGGLEGSAGSEDVDSALSSVVRMVLGDELGAQGQGRWAQGDVRSGEVAMLDPVDTCALNEGDIIFLNDAVRAVQLAARIVDTPCSEMHSDAFVQVFSLGQAIWCNRMTNISCFWS